ncbi:MAG: NapC/NirT family cytochrome c [Acidobacteriota bacterium]
MSEPEQESSPVVRPKPSRWRRGLLFVGIDATRRRFFVRLRPRFFGILASIAGVMVIAVLATAAYSESPSFCRSCHIMEPYYQAWASSPHKSVACVECHYPPSGPRTILWHKFQAMSQVVKFVTRTYSSKPYAEVEDASCLRSGCHSNRLLQGRVVSKSGIMFDHRPHLEGVRYGKQLRCVSCHSQVVVGRHIEVTWDTCYLCHMKGRKSGRDLDPIGGCLGCHVAPDKKVQVGNITYDHKSFLGKHAVPCISCHQDAIQGEGDVPKDRCFSCHNQPEKLERYGDTAFLHDNHVTKHNTACFHCHEQLRHGSTPAGTKTLNYNCNVCHTDMHESQRDMYLGTGGKGVPPMPSPMYLANVDCVGCHLQKKNNHVSAVGGSDTYVGTEQGCLDCHDPQYKGILTDVNTVIQDTASRLDEKLRALQDERAKASEATPERVRLGEGLDDVLYNLQFVRSAHPVHNIYYAAQVLRFSNAQMDEIAKKLNIKVAATDDLPLINGGFCATMCHAKVGVKVPPDTVTYKGKEMPHRTHFEQEEIPCTDCHVFGEHKDVKLLNDKVCAECH